MLHRHHQHNVNTIVSSHSVDISILHTYVILNSEGQKKPDEEKKKQLGKTHLSASGKTSAGNRLQENVTAIIKIKSKRVDQTNQSKSQNWFSREWMKNGLIMSVCVCA